ncbi:hypothetical protein MBLNU230_g6638t1 [Neophaeotheca triangularis]
MDSGVGVWRYWIQSSGTVPLAFVLILTAFLIATAVLLVVVAVLVVLASVLVLAAIVPIIIPVLTIFPIQHLIFAPTPMSTPLNRRRTHPKTLPNSQSNRPPLLEPLNKHPPQLLNNSRTGTIQLRTSKSHSSLIDSRKNTSDTFLKLLGTA